MKYRTFTNGETGGGEANAKESNSGAI